MQTIPTTNPNPFEWAGQTVHYSAWARIYYDRMLTKGKKHAAIPRAVAFKWIRILWVCCSAAKPTRNQAI